MVVDVDGESQPLLSHHNEEEDGRDESLLSRCISNIRSSWPVYQIVLLLLVYQVSYFGQVAALIDLARDMTCARYYERHPDLIDPSDDHQCSADIIETQTAQMMLVIDLFGGIGSAIATIYFGKKFSTWGRKPVLIISLCTIILLPLICTLIPRGYPYGPLPSEAFINPSTSIYMLLATSAVNGLLGGTSLPICCFRLLVVDHSDTADRTKNLVYVMAAYLLGITLGPLISSAAAYLIPMYALGIDRAIFSLVHRLFRLDSNNFSLSSIHQNEHGNVTPFILCVLGGVFSVVYVVFFVKETAFSTQAAAEVGMASSEDSSTLSPGNDSKPSKLPITPLRALFPIKQKDGTYDMRITALFLVMIFLFCGGSGFEMLILFFGHAMQWTPSAIGYLISSIGATRLFTIFVLIPFLLAFLERNVRRSTSIAHLSVEELYAISKKSSSEETPTDESAFISERDLDDARLLQGAISLWRAKIDRSIVLLSWGAEVVGWLVIAIGATFYETHTLVFGIIFTGLGVSGVPSLQSFGLTVTSDVLAGAQKANRKDDDDEDDEEESSSSHHGHAGEIFFSLLSIGESIVTTIMPILNNLVYSATLSTFPAACFIIAGAAYSLALVTISTIAIHHHHQ